MSAKLALVGRKGLVGDDWGRSWGWSWGRCWTIGRLGWRYIGNRGALILDISNISRVAIQDIVGDNLNAAIRESNTVTTVCGVAVEILKIRKHPRDVCEILRLIKRAPKPCSN